jgi:hypothetical protein
MPEVPSFEMNYGARGNTMKIDLSRAGCSTRRSA